MACLKLAATRVYALGFLSDGSSAPCAVDGWNLSEQDCFWCWWSSEGEVGSVLGLEWRTFSGKVDVSMTWGNGGCFVGPGPTLARKLGNDPTYIILERGFKVSYRFRVPPNPPPWAYERFWG